MKIFDSLSHIKKDGKWYETKYDASIGRLLKEFDKGLTKTILVGMPDDDIDYLLETANKYKEKFIPVAPVFFNEKTTNEEIEKQILNYKNMGFKGIKIHPRFLNTSLADKKIIDSIKIAGTHQLISLLCTVHRAPSRPLKRPVYDMLHEICDETKGSKTMLLHGGYYDLLATSEVIRFYENVLLDLSATIMRYQETSLAKDIEFLFHTFDKRICIGSDFPEYTIGEVIDVINRKVIVSGTIDNEKIEDIFYNNLDRFWSIA